MTINSNTDLIQYFDGNQPIWLVRIFDGTNNARENAGQCFALETLRSLMMTGMSVQSYNDMSGLQWAELCLDSAKRAAENPLVDINSISVEEALGACGMGGNYFEVGYVTLIGATEQEGKVNFTRNGGVT